MLEKNNALTLKELKDFVFGEKFIQDIEAAYEIFRNDSVINDGKNWADVEAYSLNELHHHVLKKSKRYAYLMGQFKGSLRAFYTAGIYLYWGIGYQWGLGTSLFNGAIRSSSTNPELLCICEKVDRYEVTAAFGLTELGHGSNTKGMMTTAHYDPKTQEFVLNTPTFDAMKCWPGNLGKTAMYCVVYAQLYTPDLVCHGLHGFVVQIRDETLMPLPGVTAGDMGRKLGANVIDNGYMLLKNVRIPRTYLLNKYADVLVDGQYIQSHGDRFAATMFPLSAGRISIAHGSTRTMILAITIALRYSFSRKQFSPVEGADELPVISYQLQQWRLLPYLACCYVWHFSTGWLREQLDELIEKKDTSELISVGKELHALSCAAKSVSSWLTQNCIQETREACGGHGYLTVNRLGNFRNDHDPSVTYEGDNNCILMQTSTYLLSLYRKIKKGQFVHGKLGSIDFLNGMQHLSNKCHIKTIEDITPQVISDAYHWLVTYLLEESSKHFMNQLQTSEDTFTAKNNSQVYYCRTLAIAFVENFVLQKYLHGNLCYAAPKYLPVFRTMFLLNGLWLLERHMATLYQGGYLTSGNQGRIIREAILQYCSQLKQDALVLVDVIAPPDWVLKSPIGLSNLDPHKNLFEAMVTDESQKRPFWWKELLNAVDAGSKSHLITSKL